VYLNWTGHAVGGAKENDIHFKTWCGNAATEKQQTPRDKIYFLLGLMGDRMEDILKPDYSKSFGNVCLHTTSKFSTQTNRKRCV
jgi:hypothetical protein